MLLFERRGIKELSKKEKRENWEMVCGRRNSEGGIQGFALCPVGPKKTKYLGWNGPGKLRPVNRVSQDLYPIDATSPLFQPKNNSSSRQYVARR
jgi:hypothetical protein